MQKHAFLIMAHNNFEVLEKLLLCLDNSNIDFFLHIDKKSYYDASMIKKQLKYSSLFTLSPMKIYWADYTQVKCELRLLEAAFNQSKYDYFHIMSGSDLPLKPVQSILNFFEVNKGKEFIQFHNFKSAKKTEYWILRYHIFSKKISTSKNRHTLFLYKLLNKTSLIIQQVFHIEKFKPKNYVLCKGANWVSITKEATKYIIKQKPLIKNLFNKSRSPDEYFIQSILYNSPFKKNIYNAKFDDNYESCQRFIDWKRGNPYVFKKDDYDTLISSNFLFARKFQYTTDSDIVNYIYNKNIQNEQFFKK